MFADISAAGGPCDQWDAVPAAGKLQILGTIALLEVVGERGTPHYTKKGGKPGFYPEIKGKGGPGGHFLFNLWDPFNFTTKRTAEQKERGLKCEILNGRAAMVGIMGMLSASTVPGSVPFLSGIEGFPQYSGNVMIPFEGDFTLF